MVDYYRGSGVTDSIIASQQRGPGFAYSIQVLQLLPQSIDMHVGLTGDSQLAIDVNVSMSGCLSVYALRQNGDLFKWIDG